LILGALTSLLGAITAAQFSDLLPAPNYALWLQVAAAPVLVATVLLLVWAFRRGLDRGTMAQLGLRWPRRPWSEGAAGLAAGFLASGVPILVVWLGLRGFEPTTRDVSTLTWALIPTLALLAFHEELVCRGYLLQNFLDAQRPVLGAFISSALFWLFHSLNPSAWESPVIGINLFGAGVLLALAYLTTRTLWLPTLLHFVWNVTQGILFELPISGLQADGWLGLSVVPGTPEWITGGSFGIEASMLVTASEGVLLVVFLLALRQKRNTPEAPPEA
jgi:membrane protease YdiL (CAAX protease family)